MEIISRTAIRFARSTFFLVLLGLAAASPVFALCAAFDAALAGTASTDPACGGEPSLGAQALFVENKGQWADDSLRFSMQKSGANVLIYDDTLGIHLLKRDDKALQSATIKARFKGANKVCPVAVDRVETVYHYFRGVKEQSCTNVPAFRAVAYPGLYDGIDLYVKSGEKGLKLEFHIAPACDWRNIALAYEGIDSLHLDDKGRLSIATPAGQLTDAAPVIFQEIGGERVAVDGRFRLINGKTCGFELTGNYDSAFPIIIDPDLLWSTYLGGSDRDAGNGVTTDDAENLYVVGLTRSSNFPTSGSFDSSHNGDWDAFVSKFTPEGNLMWSTYLGGSSEDRGEGIAYDQMGNICIVGRTYSTNLPTPGGYDVTPNGDQDAFVSKFSADGELLWSTYLGGNSRDDGIGIATDTEGNIYVGGHTISSNFPTINGYDTGYNGGLDVFLSKFSPGGELLWSTYLGGSDDDGCWGCGVRIATDTGGNTYVGGHTISDDFPTSGGYDTSYNGSWDGFLLKMNTGGALVWSTFLGGENIDWVHGVSVNAGGNICVTGYTESGDFPTSAGWDMSYNDGGRDAFVSLFSEGGALRWSTFLGGSSGDIAWDIAADTAGNTYVTGHTTSSDFPTSAAYDSSHNGNRDAFVTKLNAMGVLVWSTFLGGSSSDTPWAVATDGEGNAYVTGETDSTDFPVPNGYDTTYNGGTLDAFVSKLSFQGPTSTPTPTPSATATVSPTPTPTVTPTSTQTPIPTPTPALTGTPTPSPSPTATPSETVTPAPTLTETPSPTPTPTPTPWQVVFEFATSGEGWTSQTVGAVFDSPLFVLEPGYLKMVCATNTNTFGYWRSPADALAVEATYLYRARFDVSTNITNQTLVPQIRLRANSSKLQQSDYVTIESRGAGQTSPVPGGSDYVLYFVPPANASAMMLAFDLLNFDPLDAASAEVALDSVIVNRFALTELPTATIIRNYTFETSVEGWTMGGAAALFTPPNSGYSGGALSLAATNNTDTFGYWQNTASDMTIGSNLLYRGTFAVRTDVTSKSLVPQMRLRFNTANLQASRTLGVESVGDGANSPGSSNTIYDRLHFLPPPSCVGSGLIVSFDMLNFDPSDAPNGSLVLERATIESLSPPATP